MLFHILLPFTLCHMIYIVIPQHCDKGEYSIFGKMLRGHIFKTIKVSTPHECLQACNNDIRCRSFNYVIMRDVCELNNRTKEARPENFVPDSKRYYFKRTAKSGKFFQNRSLTAWKQTKREVSINEKKWESAIVGMKVFSTRQSERRSDIGRCISQTWSILMTPKLAFMAPEKLCLARTGCSNSIAPRRHLVKKR